ncbi:MAG: hypothetical protein A3F74_17290 [Betaproteobacteria bacterium RIFCSPLOWO2_12_FULL_62_58]|nr:MAG: hypothetical protein A3F74_17290 [Betaproteobacteria bacterium RIFCSPLOWO2_12_FULL_62_58]
MPELRVPLVAELPARRLRAMLMAGVEASECRRVLERGGINLVSEVLRGQGEFVEYEHYPKEDVYDPDTRAQYYYHAHRPGEHGHFHTFLRVGNGNPDGSPAGDGPDSGEPVHLIAISMDDYGWPIGLFATNHWVCGGAWRSAAEVIALLPRFQIEHAFPSWPVNRWIGAMMVLFRPHIEALLRHRDQVIANWARAHPGSEVLEDRALGVTGYLPISVEETVQSVRALAAESRRR